MAAMSIGFRKKQTHFSNQMFETKFKIQIPQMVGILLLNSYKIRNFYENLQSEEGQDFSFLIGIPQMVGFHFKENHLSWEFS